MKERASSATAAAPEVSHLRDSTIIATPIQAYMQYPERAPQPYSWRSHQDTLLSHPSENIRSAPPIIDTRNSRHPPKDTPASIGSLVSNTGPHQNSPEPRRSSTPANPASAQQRTSRGDIGHAAHYVHDAEKANPTGLAGLDGPHTNRAFPTHISEEEEVAEEHTIWILIYLAFFSPLVASCISIYTVLTTLVHLLLSPLSYLCRSCKPLNQQLQKCLRPPIHIQLGLVSSAEPELNGPNPGDSTSNTVLLVLVNIISPIYAIGIAVLAWVAGGFWATALILGNPDGRDGKDDGKIVVLGVRRLWERWLKRGLR